MKLIEIKNVTKKYNQNNKEIEVLKETNFSASEGELIAILGPSGSGKSTFLTIVGGLQSPTNGEVIINNKSLSNLKKDDITNLRFTEIGFILQSSNLIPYLKVSQQILLNSKIKKEKPNIERMNYLLDMLHIGYLKNKFPHQMSGGEKQRVGICKAVYHNPSIILADEPTASLDTKEAFAVVELLKLVTKKEKKVTIMVTHDPRMTSFCDKVYNMVDGVLTEDKSFTK